MENHSVSTNEKVQTPFLAIGILFILTVGISFIPASWFGIKPEVRRYEPIDLSNLGSSFSESDTDNDGTLSWKEFISGSLGINTSGTAQAAEVDQEAIAILNDENNLTSSFSKNLYIASTVLKQNNITDALSEQETINQLIAQEAKKIVPRTYTEQDILVARVETADSRKDYGNNLAVALTNLMTEETMTTELTSIITFLEKGDEGALLPLKRRVEEIHQMQQTLLAMEVPRTATRLHIMALNRIETYKRTIENLSLAYNDPIRATLSISTYQEDIIAAGRMYPEYAAYFKTSNTIFASTDPGAVFASGISTNQ